MGNFFQNLAGDVNNGFDYLVNPHGGWGQSDANYTPPNYSTLNNPTYQSTNPNLTTDSSGKAPGSPGYTATAIPSVASTAQTWGKLPDGSGATTTRPPMIQSTPGAGSGPDYTSMPGSPGANGQGYRWDAASGQWVNTNYQDESHIDPITGVATTSRIDESDPSAVATWGQQGNTAALKAYTDYLNGQKNPFNDPTMMQGYYDQVGHNTAIGMTQATNAAIARGMGGGGVEAGLQGQVAGQDAAARDNIAQAQKMSGVDWDQWMTKNRNQLTQDMQANNQTAVTDASNIYKDWLGGFQARTQANTAAGQLAVEQQKNALTQQQLDQQATQAANKQSGDFWGGLSKDVLQYGPSAIQWLQTFLKPSTTDTK